MRIGLFCTLLTLSACSGDSDTANGDDDDDTKDYGQQFEDKFCAEYEDCTGATSCPLTAGTIPPGATPPSTTTADCNFDQQAADDCLNGDWTCQTVDGFSFVVSPPECCAVCGDNPCQGY
jgi:hypothetical protein